MFREEESEEWKRIGHKIDLGRIVHLFIARNITKAGLNGASSTL